MCQVRSPYIFQHCTINYSVCVRTWLYEQPQETQGHVPENEDDSAIYVCLQSNCDRYTRCTVLVYLCNHCNICIIPLSLCICHVNSHYCFSYFFNIPTNAHNIYTLKTTKIHNKTLNTCPYMCRSLIKTILRGLVYCTLPSY